MKPTEKLEARQVAILRDPRTAKVVGKLYLWGTGEVDPMWFSAECLDAVAEPLTGESPNWANWKLDGSTKREYGSDLDFMI